MSFRRSPTRRYAIVLGLTLVTAALGSCSSDKKSSNDSANDATLSDSRGDDAAIEVTMPTTASTLPSTIQAPTWEHTYPNKTNATIVLQRVFTDNEASGLEADQAKEAPAAGLTRVVVIAEMKSSDALPTLDTSPLAVVNAKTLKVYRDNPDPDALDKKWGFCNGPTLDGPWDCVSAEYFDGTAYVRGAIDVPVAEVDDLRVGWLVEPNGGCEPGAAQNVRYIPEGASAAVEGCLYEVPLAK